MDLKFSPSPRQTNALTVEGAKNNRTPEEEATYRLYSICNALADALDMEAAEAAKQAVLTARKPAKDADVLPAEPVDA